MPKSPRAAEQAGATTTMASSNGASANGEPAFFKLDVLRARADRLARAARESCHQHRRCATFCGRDEEDAAELNAMLELAAVADRQLEEAAEAYAKAGAKLQPPDGDEKAWWQKANALWHASREHVRRHSIGDRLSKRAGTDPSVERLTELHVEYELEASAVLSLQQAADAYCKARPAAL